MRDLSTWRQLAQEATPGPYVHVLEGSQLGHLSAPADSELIGFFAPEHAPLDLESGEEQVVAGVTDEQRLKDIAFLTQCSPELVLETIGRVQSAEAIANAKLSLLKITEGALLRIEIADHSQVVPGMMELMIERLNEVLPDGTKIIVHPAGVDFKPLLEKTILSMGYRRLDGEDLTNLGRLEWLLSENGWLLWDNPTFADLRLSGTNDLRAAISKLIEKHPQGIPKPQPEVKEPTHYAIVQNGGEGDIEFSMAVGELGKEDVLAQLNTIIKWAIADGDEGATEFVIRGLHLEMPQ